ncbi:MAG: T9SS type A sorting domain-containing protein [Bacteroidota bacterium]|nr:T9SS type A sorting domain-containing protein [Bacteroidota bacterium]|tara:strand:+ start:263 stop:592 length:330 start_codon:yes stop_codon:yes gene_type:complete
MSKVFIVALLLNLFPDIFQERNDIYNAEIYPNPASEYINLKINSDIEIDNIQFSIYTLIGNEMSLDMEKISEKEIRFNLNNYNTGYYFLSVRNQKDNKSKILKFSKTSY